MGSYYPLPPVEDAFTETWFAGALHNRNYYHEVSPPVRITVERLNNAPAAFGPRPLRVEGVVLPLYVGHRHLPPQPAAGYDTTQDPNVDPGHLMALVLGGPEDAMNVAPQWADWQRNGPWREMERVVQALALAELDGSRPAHGGLATRSLYYVVEIFYRPFGPLVCPTIRTWAFPTHFTVYVYRCDLQGNRDPGPPLRTWPRLEGFGPNLALDT